MLQVGATEIEEDDCLGNIVYLNTIIRINMHTVLSWKYFVSVPDLGLTYKLQCLGNVTLRNLS
jgi:hypothetical protein